MRAVMNRVAKNATSTAEESQAAVSLTFSSSTFHTAVVRKKAPAIIPPRARSPKMTFPTTKKFARKGVLERASTSEFMI